MHTYICCSAYTLCIAKTSAATTRGPMRTTVSTGLISQKETSDFRTSPMIIQNTYKNACIHIHIYICIYSYIYIYIYIYIHSHIYIYIYIHTHTCIYIYIHIYIYVCIYVRIHTHTKPFLAHLRLLPPPPPDV